jgi:hypothetical protein
VYLGQRISHATVVARIARGIAKPNICLGSRQGSSVPTDHLRRFAWTEQSLQCLALMRFGAECMHAAQKSLTTRQNIA